MIISDTSSSPRIPESQSQCSGHTHSVTFLEELSPGHELNYCVRQGQPKDQPAPTFQEPFDAPETQRCRWDGISIDTSNRNADTSDVISDPGGDESRHSSDSIVYRPFSRLLATKGQALSKIDLTALKDLVRKLSQTKEEDAWNDMPVGTSTKDSRLLTRVQKSLPPGHPLTTSSQPLNHSDKSTINAQPSSTGTIPDREYPIPSPLLYHKRSKQVFANWD